MAESATTSQGLVAQTRARRISQIGQIEHEWIVEHLCLLPTRHGRYLDSPLFHYESGQTRKWKIRMYPKQNPPNDKAVVLGNLILAKDSTPVDTSLLHSAAKRRFLLLLTSPHFQDFEAKELSVSFPLLHTR